MNFYRCRAGDISRRPAPRRRHCCSSTEPWWWWPEDAGHASDSGHLSASGSSSLHARLYRTHTYMNTSALLESYFIGATSLSLMLSKRTVLATRFAIGRGFLSACGRTDDLGWGDTVIWYVSMRQAVRLPQRQPSSDIWLKNLPLIWARWRGTRVYGKTANWIPTGRDVLALHKSQLHAD